MDNIDAKTGTVAKGKVGQKRMREEVQEDMKVHSEVLRKWMHPVEGLANMRREFGEHGGVNMSIEASTTFTVMEPETMGELFEGKLGPDRDFYIYSRCACILHCVLPVSFAHFHFNGGLYILYVFFMQRAHTICDETCRGNVKNLHISHGAFDTS